MHSAKPSHGVGTTLPMASCVGSMGWVTWWAGCAACDHRGDGDDSDARFDA